jgi:preprotein translocase subunit SecE
VLGVRIPPGLRTVREEKMFKKLSTYLQDVKTEMAKVSWPSKDELVESTTIVIILSLILAVFVFGVDQGLSNILKIIL